MTTSPPSSPTLDEQIEPYLAQLAAKGRAEGTIYGYGLHLRDLARFLDARGARLAVDIQTEALLAYQEDLTQRVGRTTKKPWSVSAQKDALIVIKGFFRWLVRTAVLVHDPAADIELPRTGNRLPTRPLTHNEVERFLESIDLTNPLNVRERAVIEVVYSTGLRCAELLGLDLDDLDSERGMVHVRHGKGDEPRIVPIGDRAMVWARRYIADVRPSLLRWPDQPAVFLSMLGGRLSSAQLHRRLKDLGLTQSRRVHRLRHTMAVVMHERGASIRHIQAMLGHRDLSTSTVYTKVSIDALKDVHRRTHPAERKTRRED